MSRWPLALFVLLLPTPVVLAVLIFRSVLSDALDLWNGAGPLGLVVFLAVPMIIFLAWALPRAWDVIAEWHGRPVRATREREFHIRPLVVVGGGWLGLKLARIYHSLVFPK